MPTQAEVYARISAPRMASYEAEALARGGGFTEAWALYEWNKRVAGAFLPVLQTAEVVLRNSISLAFAPIYGGRWLADATFQGSLKRDTQKGLRDALARHGGDVNKCVPDLKFVFWEELVTTRHTGRVWAGEFATAFPACPAGWGVTDVQGLVYKVRRFRNRVAHAEPLFKRALGKDLANTFKLIGVCSAAVEAWARSALDPSAVMSLTPPR